MSDNSSQVIDCDEQSQNSGDDDDGAGATSSQPKYKEAVLDDLDDSTGSEKAPIDADAATETEEYSDCVVITDHRRSTKQPTAKKRVCSTPKSTSKKESQRKIEEKELELVKQVLLP